MSDSPPPTADQLVDGFTRALAAGESDVAVSLLVSLRAVDPVRAARLYMAVRRVVIFAHHL